MYCTRCGLELTENSKFCAQCGSAVRGTAGSGAGPAYPVLSRPVFGKKIAGVCAGFARYYGVDVTLVRILWLVLVIWPLPIGLIAYLIAWIAMPRDPIPASAPHAGNA